MELQQKRVQEAVGGSCSSSGTRNFTNGKGGSEGPSQSGPILLTPQILNGEVMSQVVFSTGLFQQLELIFIGATAGNDGETSVYVAGAKIIAIV